MMGSERRVANGDHVGTAGRQAPFAIASRDTSRVIDTNVSRQANRPA